MYLVVARHHTNTVVGLVEGEHLLHILPEGWLYDTVIFEDDATGLGGEHPVDGGLHTKRTAYVLWAKKGVDITLPVYLREDGLANILHQLCLSTTLLCSWSVLCQVEMGRTNGTNALEGLEGCFLSIEENKKNRNGVHDFFEGLVALGRG